MEPLKILRKTRLYQVMQGKVKVLMICHGKKLLFWKRLGKEDSISAVENYCRGAIFSGKEK